MRVLGIDPGTVSIDLCGLDDGRVFLDVAMPTGDALADPAAFVDRLARSGPLDLIVGPSGYGLPLTRVQDLSESTIRLALLNRRHDGGGIGGLGALLRALAASDLPAFLTPGVVHLASVPRHRKINRIDMGTADKVCAVALAVVEQAARRQCAVDQVSLILVELGGAFTAAVAVREGQIVDGVGGSAGPLGMRSSGALDGEVAVLAGQITKALLFEGGVETVRGGSPRSPDGRTRLALDAYLEGVCKTVAALAVSVPHPAEVILSGRWAQSAEIRDQLSARLRSLAPVVALHGFARIAKHAAQGAALIADGLAGGSRATVVERLGLRDAAGTALDSLYVISPERARRQLES